MKTPKVDWPSKSKTEKVLNATGMTESVIENLIEDSISKAQKIAKMALDSIAPIVNADRDSWESAWNSTGNLTKWFGKVSKANHVKDVYDKLDVVCSRFANKKQTIKVRDDLPKNYVAQNLGGPLSPNTFKVSAAWINLELNQRAVIMLHESFHSWFKDQKIDGQTVYGSSLAEQLAREDPGKARRSPENYEQYCQMLQDFQDRLALKKSLASA